MSPPHLQFCIVSLLLCGKIVFETVMSEFRVVRWNELDAPEAARLRACLEAEGYHVYLWTDRSGAVYEMHRHESDQSHWIVSGELEITLEAGESYRLKPGDRDFLPARTWHAARVIGSEPVSYLIGEKL
jgi:quercetin dioxygenase-like cupin family protein